MKGLRTHCYKGHPLEGENIVFERKGRRCKICTLANKARVKARARIDRYPTEKPTKRITPKFYNPAWIHI